MQRKARPTAATPHASASKGMSPGQPHSAADKSRTAVQQQLPHAQASARDEGEGLSAANVAWQGGGVKRHKKVMSRMQPRAATDAPSPTEHSLPAISGNASSVTEPAPTHPAPHPAGANNGSAEQPLPSKAAGSNEQHQAFPPGQHSLSQLPQRQEPKVASSDSTDSVVAFPSRHLQAGHSHQEAVRDEIGTESNPFGGKAPGHWKPTDSRGAGALSFLKAAGPVMKGAADSKDAYWSGVSDADIAHTKSFSG